MRIDRIYNTLSAESARPAGGAADSADSAGALLVARLYCIIISRHTLIVRDVPILPAAVVVVVVLVVAVVEAAH